jgi:hypothetical protein
VVQSRSCGFSTSTLPNAYTTWASRALRSARKQEDGHEDREAGRWRRMAAGSGGGQGHDIVSQEYGQICGSCASRTTSLTVLSPSGYPCHTSNKTDLGAD